MASSTKIRVLFPEFESLADELRRLRDLVENTPRLAVKDVLRRFGWSRSTLYNRLRDGFPRPKAGLWRPADLDEWEDGQVRTDGGQV